MIPHTYPTFMDAQKKAYMKVFFLSSVSGLTKWIDYIPVKTVAFSATNEGTTNTGGHMTVTQVASDTALAKWRDYIPVYEDASATVAWSSNANGYIPVCQLLSLDFTSGIIDSRITFTRADAVTCATYFDSTGRLATVAANVARFDYDPATAAGVTGGELVTNGTFSDGTTGWITFGTAGNVTVSNGQIRVNAADGVNSGFTQVTFLTVGKRYRLTFNLISVTGAGIQVNDNVGPIYGTYTTAGTQTVDFIASTSSLQFKRAAGVVDATLDDISVKELAYTPRGLLIEESRKNNLLHSRDMTQAAWTKTDVTPARTQVGIDGVANTACLMTEGSAGTAITSQSGSAVTAGSTVTASVVFKRGNTDWVILRCSETTGTNGVRVWANLATGALGNVTAFGAATNATGTIVNLGGGWYRVTATCTPDGTFTVPSWLILSANANGSTTRVSGATYIVDCAQLEVGAFATSIIPCGATALTRAADSASMTGTNFSSWFNASAGTFVAEADALLKSTAQQSVLSADDGTLNNRLELAVNTLFKGRLQVVTGGVAQSDINDVGTAIAANTAYKLAATFAANDFQVCLNTTLGTQDTSGTVPTVTQLVIGGRGVGGTPYNGHIRSLRFYPSRLSNATLQALTA